MPTAEFILVSTKLTTPTSSILVRANQLRGGQSKQAQMEASNVRRPLRGIQLKRETFATLSVSDGINGVDLYNSSIPEGEGGNYTSNFLLQSVSETRSEKFQPVTTFGAAYGFFFGEQPRMVTFSAILLNTADFQWEVEWWSNYEEYTRGTKVTDRGMRTYMTYDDVVIEGYLLNAITSKNTSTPHEVNLTFTMWVTGVEYLVRPGDTMFPESAGTTVDYAGIEELNAQLNSKYPMISTTAGVRAANLDALTNADEGSTGLLGKLRSTLSKTQDMLGQAGKTISRAKSFLYGRNLVIPAGFAGSEIGGTAILVGASGNVASFTGLSQGDLLSQITTGLNVTVPVNFSDPIKRRPIYDNVDEYLVRASKLQELPKEETNNIQTRDDLLTRAAVDAFGEMGITVTNMEGQSRSELSRALGRVAYGAVTIGGAVTGASQAAASLTVGNVVGKISSDGVESATAGTPEGPT